MKTLYLDCFSGISGDMFAGALIDAGADPEALAEELKKLNITDEYELSWNTVIKNGISSTKFDVLLTGESSPEGHGHHDEDHAHDHDHHHHHEHEDADHHHAHSHDHDHDHSHDGGSHHHDHRTYKHIVKLIESSELASNVKTTALKIFKKIGEAEGHIHGMPLEEVHFHEVGAVDSIIDIVGAAILLDQLDIDKIKASPVPVGSGKIRIDHGIYPVPAPATLEMLRGIPVAESSVKAELTTPTGAAFIAVLAEAFGPLPAMKIESVGYGAGTKTFRDHPNVLRVVIGEE